MCGIFGYVGGERDARDAVLEGLQQLDYRGYDSWGIATYDGTLHTDKKVGAVPRTMARLPGHTGIGHTRWATHGSVTDVNAHPHAASDGSFVLAHNGIVENADELKRTLSRAGYAFNTQTDTEAIVRLVELNAKKHPLPEAVRLACRELTGRNTIIVLAKNGTVIAVKNGSPLVLGRGAERGVHYISSDVLSFSAHVREVAVLENEQMIVLEGTRVSGKTLQGRTFTPRFEKNAIVGAKVSKDGFPHFMLKEIHESGAVVRAVMKSPQKQLGDVAQVIRRARHVYCIGSGTAGAAAAQIAYYLRVYGRINATELIGAEASDRLPFFTKRDVIIAPSQSGETADVLEVLEYAQARGATIVTYVNMPGSSMSRLADHSFMAQAGPEICVMSTKIFVSQLAWGYLLAKTVGGKRKAALSALRSLARALDSFLTDASTRRRIRDAAMLFSKSNHLFLIGKGQNKQIIKEGMVKIIEGAYVHAHGIPAGDLKHYAITLMEKGTPVIAVVSKDSLQSDVLNAIHEVKARGARVFGIAPSPSPHFDSYLPTPECGETSAIFNVVPLQLLAYEMAVMRGNNVDKPRNIAKSVTVK